MNIDLQILQLTNDENFKYLEELYNRINVFRITGMGNQEIKHSNFLAWLMDPRSSHDLQDTFIKNIARAFRKIGIRTERYAC